MDGTPPSPPARPSRPSRCSASSRSRTPPTPTLRFHLHVDDPLGRAIHTIALSTQIQIDPARRAYDPETQARLVELFGPPERWASTTQVFRWAHVAALVPGFTGATSFALEVPCTYDLEVAASKYFYSLSGGEVPLSFLFNGMVLYQRRGRPPAGRPGPVELHGALAHAGRRLEARDGRLLPRRRLGPAATRRRSTRSRPARRPAGTTPSTRVVAELLAMSQLDELVDTLLWEGHQLYPYTPSATKNATPTPFGIVYPPAYAAGSPHTFDRLKLQCIATGTTAFTRDRALPRGRRGAAGSSSRRARAPSSSPPGRCAGGRGMATEDFGGLLRVTVAVREHDGGRRRA